MAADLSALMSQALAIRAGGERLALHASTVVEVMRVPPLTRVPNAPSALSGLANVRGAVVPVVSLSIALGDGEQSRTTRSRLVLVNAGEPVALLVDEVLRLGGEGEALGERLLNLPELLEKAFAGLRSPCSTLRSVGGEAEDVAIAQERVDLLAFGIGSQEFALPLEGVISVLALPDDVSAVPRTDNAMLGMTPWRDRLLPLLSTATLLNLSSRGNIAGQRVVVANIGGASVGLVADSLSAILRVPKDDIDPVPTVLTRGNAEAEIAGVCRLDGGRRLVSILAADRLLRDGLAERLVEEEETVGDAVTIDSSNDRQKFVVFRLGEEEFGLPIDRIEEVVRAPEQLTRLPKAPAFIEGVMNLRGRVLPVIDQRLRFASSARAHAAKSRIIVVRIGNSEAGFRVDDVTEVLHVRPDELARTPDLAADDAGIIDRIATIGGRMILLIDAQELLDRAERDILGAMAKPETT